MLLREDQTLLEGYRRGDTDVLGVIYRHFRPKIEQYLCSGFVFTSEGRTCRFHGFDSPSDLDDAVAETFSRGLGRTARRNYDPKWLFESYLTRIARNWVIGRLRSERRERQRSQSLMSGLVSSSLSGVTPAPLMTPEDEACAAQMRRRLEGGLGELAPEDRQCVDMLIEDRSQREIAAALGIRRSDVRRRVYGLRQRLMRALVSRGISPGEVMAWFDGRSGQGRSMSWSTTDWRSGSWTSTAGRPTARPLALPVTFGSYSLLEKIGEGGMAEVYKAKKLGVEGFERFVAVKLMRPEVARRSTFVSMFIDEAKIAVQITHRNIGRVMELGRHRGVYFMAMEFIEGSDLRSVWEAKRAGGGADIYMACYVAAEVAEALDYAHSHIDASGRPLHIVHQDVSPRNILIGNNGEVKVIDFGLAKAAIQSSPARSSLRRGTLRYMSPEQLQGGDVDGRSDIFSLGVVLYELLTLDKLFSGRGDIKAMSARRRATPMPPSATCNVVPPSLDAIVLRALAAQPEDRFQTAGQMAEALRALARRNAVHYGARELARDAQVRR